MDAAAFEAELRRDGYEVLHRELGPGVAVPEHSHPWDVRLLVLEGEITVECEGQRRTCGAGDTFGLEAGLRHSELHGPQGVRLIAGRRHIGKAST